MWNGRSEFNINVGLLALLLASPSPIAAQGLTPLSQTTFESFQLTLERTIDIGGCQGPAVADIPDIRFAKNSADLQPGATAPLSLLTRAMAADRHATFALEGHASADGPEAFNWTLSRDRVQTVAAHLTATGADPRRLSVDWFGETRPLLPYDPEHPDNRRVSFLKIGVNSAIYDIATGTETLSVKIVVQRGAVTWVLDPVFDAFQTGDTWIACVAAAQDGEVTLLQRTSGGFEPLGTWQVPKGALMKAPTTGAVAVVPPAQTEHLRLRFVPATAACRGGTVFEAIVLSAGRPQAQPAPEIATPCRCTDPGVICRDIAIAHEAP